jgi:hypothetical protein
MRKPGLAAWLVSACIILALAGCGTRPEPVTPKTELNVSAALVSRKRCSTSGRSMSATIRI